jgi:sulfur relay (sulfurtransferase) DsrC/TusE family protein
MEVDKETYLKHLENWPNKLTKDYCHLHTPAALMFWDTKDSFLVAKEHDNLTADYKVVGYVYHIYSKGV